MWFNELILLCENLHDKSLKISQTQRGNDTTTSSVHELKGELVEDLYVSEVAGYGYSLTSNWNKRRKNAQTCGEIMYQDTNLRFLPHNINRNQWNF